MLVYRRVIVVWLGLLGGGSLYHLLSIVVVHLLWRIKLVSLRLADWLYLLLSRLLNPLLYAVVLLMYHIRPSDNL